MRVRDAIYMIIATGVFLCGCETAGAFGTGRMTGSDVAYIAHAGTLGRKAAPVNVDSINPDEPSSAYEEPEGMVSKPAPRAAAVDAWLEENLW
ncbi:MAG TPA: hypothetical protein PLJ26_00185 [Candidatus Omnitrophota bacterium]|nr:hypothetical protein [Candidatus Omnitrophota bacterium]HQJ14889.1 hypothetical protein [Candidatus Omnitrophota bacterium]